MVNKWIGLALVTLLSGCGGSDGSDGSSPPSLGDGDVTIVGATTITLGDGAAFYAQVSDGSSRLYQYQWQQLSGPAVNIVNPISPIAAFATTQTGSYQLQVTVGDATEVVSFTVEGNDDTINSYSDQHVVSGGRVSLRAEALDDNGNNYPEDLSWVQTAGPSVADLSSTDATANQLATFTAPMVSQDTLLSFELNSSSGLGSDVVTVLVSAEPAPVDNAFFDQPVARMTPYIDDSPWSTALVQCVYSNQINSPCSVDALPLIGQVSPEPSIDDILERLVVSHPWMGQQFENLLRDNDQFGDFRRLLSSVSAIVISSDIRPSFYWVATGAIYLDPANLWQQPWQRASINEDPDYRIGFGSELSFLTPWRYVDGDNYASPYYLPGNKSPRPWEDLSSQLTSLLYHELAHANDYFPRSTHNSISEDTLLEAYYARVESSGLPSDLLTSSYPLNSSIMFGLGEVMFYGAEPTEAQKLLQPDDVAAQFFSDRAADDYAYSSNREDLAMLFEETLMQLRYGILRDVAVTSGFSDQSSSNLIVAKGQRSRIGDASIVPRAQLIINMLLPEVGQLEGNLGTPIDLTRGLNWFEAIYVGNTSAAKMEVSTQSVAEASTNAAPAGVTYFGGRHQLPHGHHH
ncbi:hypothetical protein [Ferrimonas lipolytica]|uniref:Lipoprotein n=1 Tax=Ferrimonas lipolytica TaxID=2724191 RepID=A0A6H1UFC6_9GAMM|nr:hypothetical protein [Ferrimonas lipolytica]QIZ76916.1 hypothetical protein HER31_08535 [Ferrimonas lipolytica]